MINILYKVLGMVGTNVYFPYNEETRECVIIDPADQADAIIRLIREKDLKPVRILLTHGHFDHFMAMDAVRDHFGIPVYALDLEEQTLSDPDKNGTRGFLGRGMTVKADGFMRDGEKLELLGTEWQVIATPGHTEGSCCFYIPSEKILFAGDTLFCGSYGRCDLPGGSEAAIVRSIRGKLFTLPEDTKVLCGHMGPTTIGTEKKYNPLA